MPLPPAGGTSEGLRAWELGALALLAVVARTFNLGTFSLWLDEISLMVRAEGSPAAVWAHCLGNAEHPPLSALVMAAGNALGASDTVQRLVPVGLGVGTVLLLARWTARRFGRPAALAAGLVLALLPFHVRYSQELRPYSYLFFFAALTLLAADRLQRRPGPRAAGLLFAALVGGLYSHLLFGLILLPLAVLLGEPALAGDPKPALAGDPEPSLAGDPEPRRLARQALRWALLALAGALLLWLAWVPALLELSGRPPVGRVVAWNWHRAAWRWQFLTVGGFEGDRPTWAAALAAGLAGLGALAALRSTAGRAVLAAALAGTVGIEFLLLAAGHWTNGRYDSLGWLFLMILLGMGFGALWRQRWSRAPAALLLAALLVGEAGGLARYARVGRPDWDRVAEAVRRVHRPGEPVLAENDWTRICLGYYLQGRDFHRRRGEELAPVAVAGGPRRLSRLWPRNRPAVLVVGAFPRYPGTRRWVRTFPLVARFPRSEAEVYRLLPRAGLAPPGAGPGAASPPVPAEPRRLQNPLLAWLERLALARW